MKNSDSCWTRGRDEEQRDLSHKKGEWEEARQHLSHEEREGRINSDIC